jgi:hypothetical protein
MPCERCGMDTCVCGKFDAYGDESGSVEVEHQPYCTERGRDLGMCSCGMLYTAERGWFRI